MARLRKGVAYRSIERPYTRKSKYKKKSFIRAPPNSKVVRYDMGDSKKEYDLTLFLKAKDPVQIRHNSIEAARQSSNRVLEKGIGKMGYYYKIRVYPHHVLRENPLASGAGADRMSTGMKMSFGKPIGIAAQVKKGQIIAQVSVFKEHIQVAKTALERASHKFPCGCSVEVVQNN